MLIKLEGLLAAALLLSPALCRAQDPAPPPPPPMTTPDPGAASQASAAAESTIASKSLKNLDQQIRDASAELGRTEQCFALEASLKSELARKKAQLSAEYNGKIPVPFNDLLWQKSERINKQHKACFQQYEALGRQFTALDGLFVNIEPKSLNVKKQRALADEEKRKYLLLMPTAKPYNKSPKAKAGTN